MDYMLSAASFGAFFFALLLLGKKSKVLHDRILIAWLVYLGLFTGLYLLSSQAFFVQEAWFPVFIVSWFLLHGPFLLLYTAVLTSGKRKVKKRDLLHFAPFVAFVVYLAVAFRFPDYAAGITLDHVHTHISPPLLFVFFLLAIAASGPIYFYLSIAKVRQFKSRFEANFSAGERNTLNWLRVLLPIFGIIWTVLVLIAIAHHVFHFASMDFCINGLFLSLAVFIILMGYYGLKQEEIFAHTPIENRTGHSAPQYVTESKEKYSGVSLSEDEITAYVTKIDQHMEQERPYLNPDLTLATLASELDIPTHHLSRIINEQFGHNFFDFINGYRVADVKNKLLDPAYDNFSLLGVAFDSGFNSKSAFNRIFKKVTGHTPSEYKKLHA